MINSKKIYLFNLLMAVLPNSGCQKLKSAVLRWSGAKVGRGVELFQGLKIQGIGELEIGDCAFLGHEVMIMLNAGSKIVIEDEAIVGSRSTIVTGFHPITPEGKRILSREGTSSTVRIGRGCSVSTQCLVLPGVSIGEMAIVAAGATVNKDVDAYTMVGGCPARFIKSLRTNVEKE